MVSRLTLRALIHKTELEYRKCWETLRKIKNPSSQSLSAEDIVSFQPTLGHALFELDKMYRALHQERERLIAGKASLSEDWFAHRLKLIRDYQEVLKSTVAVGKAIGDSFAWFFYHKHREYLLEHLKHERILHTPPGIGGLGELEFIDRFRVFNNHLVIYHGTTTFLRLGDVSFIDMSTLEPVAIGELKTEKVDSQQIRITLLAFGPNGQAPILFEETTAQQKESSDGKPLLDGFPQRMKDRLNRQIKSIVESLKPSIPDAKIALNMYVPIDELTALSRNLKTSAMTYQRIGDGLVLIGFLDGRRSLYSRFVRESSFDWHEKLAGTEKHAMEIMRQGSDNNMIFINSLQVASPRYQLPLGMTPLFWWPLDLEFIEKILFQKVLLFSLYNPAHLIERLKLAGFDVKFVENERRFEVTKSLGDRTVALKGFDYFVSLVVHQLFPEETVVQIIENTIERMEKENLPDYSEVELHIYQHLLA
jgi:hypothetical protein